MLKAREAVRTLPAYHPPLEGRDGLRLDFNENTVGCSPRVLERLRQLSPQQLAKYPERGPIEVKLAEFLGISPPELLLTNGVDEAIHLLCGTYLDAGDEALIIVPTYSMYRIYMMAAGAEVVAIPAGSNFQFPVEDLCKRITGRTRLIVIANPNNPTGSVAREDELLRIAHMAPAAAMLVDEAYFDFYGQSVLPKGRGLQNLFVARTFSKAYGLAGLRVGALVCDPDQMLAVRRVSSPYSVNAVALACLHDAIDDQAYVSEYVSEIRESRRSLEHVLDGAGIRFWPSQANFVLARVSSSRAGAAAFVDRMRRRGVLVRDRSGDHGCEGCVRITLGPRKHTDRLLTALQETMKELGIVQGAMRL